MRFVTTLTIELDVAPALEKRIREIENSKLALCQMITDDMTNVIKDNVKAATNLNVKGFTVLKDFTVI